MFLGAWGVTTEGAPPGDAAPARAPALAPAPRHRRAPRPPPPDAGTAIPDGASPPVKKREACTAGTESHDSVTITPNASEGTEEGPRSVNGSARTRNPISK